MVEVPVQSALHPVCLDIHENKELETILRKKKPHLWLLSCLKLWVSEEANNHSREVSCLEFRENCRMSNLQPQTSDLSSV